MSDVQDMTSQMAKELMLGIRDNVEDIAAAFKKMSFENPDREVPEVPAEETSLPTEPVPASIEPPKRAPTASKRKSCNPLWCSSSSRKPNGRRKRSRWKTS